MHPAAGSMRCATAADKEPVRDGLHRAALMPIA
jgi:hypothetical protein